MFWIVINYLQERDPIERIRKLILAHDIATEKELKVKIDVFLNFFISNHLIFSIGLLDLR